MKYFIKPIPFYVYRVGDIQPSWVTDEMKSFETILNTMSDKLIVATRRGILQAYTGDIIVKHGKILRVYKEEEFLELFVCNDYKYGDNEYQQKWYIKQGDVEAFCLGFDEVPFWAQRAYEREDIVFSETTKRLIVHTFCGALHAYRGDYIVKDSLGLLRVYDEEEFSELFVKNVDID